MAQTDKIPAYEPAVVTGQRLLLDFPHAIEFAFGLPRGLVSTKFTKMVAEAIERNRDSLGYSAARRALNGELTGGIPAVLSIPTYVRRRVEVVLRMLDVFEVMAMEAVKPDSPTPSETEETDHALDGKGCEPAHEEGEHAVEVPEVGGGGEQRTGVGSGRGGRRTRGKRGGEGEAEVTAAETSKVEIA